MGLVIIGLVLFGAYVASLIHDKFPDLSVEYCAVIGLAPFLILLALIVIGALANIYEHLKQNTKINPKLLPLATIGAFVGIMIGGFVIALVAGIGMAIAWHILELIYKKITKD